MRCVREAKWFNKNKEKEGEGVFQEKCVRDVKTTNPVGTPQQKLRYFLNKRPKNLPKIYFSSAQKVAPFHSIFFPKSPSSTKSSTFYFKKYFFEKKIPQKCIFSKITPSITSAKKSNTFSPKNLFSQKSEM